MVTYSVRCGGCGVEMLIEHAQRPEDPGTLPAFCSPECSREFGMRLTQEMVAAGGMRIEFDCGCFAVVLGIDGPGSSFPYMVCEKAYPDEGGGFDHYAHHSNEIHLAAIAEVRRRIHERERRTW